MKKNQGLVGIEAEEGGALCDRFAGLDEPCLDGGGGDSGGEGWKLYLRHGSWTIVVRVGCVIR